MFGIGKKEIDYVGEATRAVESLDSAVIEKLPDELRFRLIKLTDPLPQFEGEIRGVTGLARVLGAGFGLYDIPEGYYVAEIGGGHRWFEQASPVRDLRYRPSMLPIRIMGKYGLAVEADLFSRFVVASPEWENFDPRTRIRNVILPVVLVGYIPDNVKKPIEFRYTTDQFDRRQREGTPGVKVVNGTGFLIAALPSVNL